VPHVVDARGLRCPLPLVRARHALTQIGPDEPLVVLADDPEAPLDIGALAADHGRGFDATLEDGVWRLTLTAEATKQ
jgi:tRNA 2-thiouridine synthesizing protein A